MSSASDAWVLLPASAAWLVSIRNPSVALPVILGFAWLPLILYLSSSAVIKRLSQLPGFSLCDCMAAAHFSHAFPLCQHCTTCFTPNYCTTDHSPQTDTDRNAESHPAHWTREGEIAVWMVDCCTVLLFQGHHVPNSFFNNMRCVQDSVLKQQLHLHSVSLNCTIGWSREAYGWKRKL